MSSDYEQDKETFFMDHLFNVIKMNHKIIGWPDIEKSDVKATYLKALSNMTYRVDCKLPGVNPILAKRFGQGFLDRLLDRSIDNMVSEVLGNIGVGPKVLYYSHRCRVEEFLLCSEFTKEDMVNPKMRLLLTYEIQKLHRAEIPGLPKGSLFQRSLDDNIHIFKLFKESVAQKKDSFTEEESKKVEFVSKLIDPQEIAWLTAKLKPYDNELVVSHNDFLNGNILKLPNGELKLIDFEYCTYNFRAYDIANFVSESLFDYTKPDAPYFYYYPEKRDTDEQIRDMIKYYTLFSAFPKNPPYQTAKYLVDHPEEADRELEILFGSQKAWQDKVDMYISQLSVGYLLSHFWWILWAITMCKNPHVQFDYIEFAYQRTLDYFHIKEKVIAKEAPQNK